MSKNKALEPDLTNLIRFTKLKDQDFKLTKIGSKSETSSVPIGESQSGHFSLKEINPIDNHPGGVSAYVVGGKFGYLRTSPIVKITEHDNISTTFETEGGIYKLQMWPIPRSELKPVECLKCSTVSEFRDMIMKMSGLLCPKCRGILFQTSVGDEFFEEYTRRTKELEAFEANKVSRDN